MSTGRKLVFVETISGGSSVSLKPAPSSTGRNMTTVLSMKRFATMQPWNASGMALVPMISAPQNFWPWAQMRWWSSLWPVTTSAGAR